VSFGTPRVGQNRASVIGALVRDGCAVDYASTPNDGSGRRQATVPACVCPCGCDDDGVKINFQVVVFDAADLAAESSFWAGVVSGTVDAEDDWHMVEVDGQPRIGVQLAPNHVPPDWPDGTSQQIHLDLWVDDPAAAHDLVMSLGATVLKEAEDDDSPDTFQLYADPPAIPSAFAGSSPASASGSTPPAACHIDGSVIASREAGARSAPPTRDGLCSCALLRSRISARPRIEADLARVTREGSESGCGARQRFAEHTEPGGTGSRTLHLEYSSRAG